MFLHEATNQSRFAVTHETVVGEVRRAAQLLAQSLGQDTATAGKVGIVATELCTNVWRHASGGDVFVQAIGGQVEILAIDRGPGMDVERALTDGYSTAGSAGQGLGAARRASAEFDLYSFPGKGSVVMSRIGPSPLVRFGAICQALRGELHCGDSWALAAGAEGIAVCVVDGLGHGDLARDSAKAMTQSFIAAPFDEPKAQLERGHARMAGTRGAAAACARVRGPGALSYAGIGNISGCLVAAESTQGLVSHSGILGVQARRVQQFEYKPPAPAVLVMHSDGVSARWNLADHPGLQRRHPAVIAAMLYREHARPRDDATIVVVNT